MSIGATGPLRVIVGPTGSGKTALVRALAERLHGTSGAPVVISADSRQVYERFVIGTAAPTVEERRAVPHELVGIVPPTARFTAAQWADAARLAMAHAESRGSIPVIVGGTGFYVRSLLAPLFAEPPIDEARRTALRRFVRSLPHEEVRRWAEALDAAGGGAGRAQRERAIELALLTGRSRSDWHRQAPPPIAPVRAVRYLVLDPAMTLADRLERRLTAMLAAGWLDEVAELARDVPEEAPAWQACGYLALRDVVAGRRGLADALDRVRIETRQYVKRQRTWFRHQLRDGPVTRLDADQPDLLSRALAWWHAAAADTPSSP